MKTEIFSCISTALCADLLQRPDVLHPRGLKGDRQSRSKDSGGCQGFHPGVSRVPDHHSHVLHRSGVVFNYPLLVSIGCRRVWLDVIRSTIWSFSAILYSWVYFCCGISSSLIKGLTVFNYPLLMGANFIVLYYLCLVWFDWLIGWLIVLNYPLLARVDPLC